jgi:hypothetical protein
LVLLPKVCDLSLSKNLRGILQYCRRQCTYRHDRPLFWYFQLCILEYRCLNYDLNLLRYSAHAEGAAKIYSLQHTRQLIFSTNSSKTKPTKFVGTNFFVHAGRPLLEAQPRKSWYSDIKGSIVLSEHGEHRSTNDQLH